MDNYQTTMDKMLHSFISYDHCAIADKMKLPFDKTYLYIPFLNRIFRFNRATGEMLSTKLLPADFSTKMALPAASFEESYSSSELCSFSGLSYTEKVGFNAAMTILDLLSYSKEGARPSGQYTVIQNLCQVMNGSSNFAGQGMFASYEKSFDGKVEALRSACIALGGEPFGKGDLGFKIPIFRDLCLNLQFWEADDEFPASIQMMFDTNSLSFIHYESCWYLAGYVMNEIARLMGVS